MAKLKADTKQEYDGIITKREEVGSRIEYPQGLLDAYKIMSHIPRTTIAMVKVWNNDNIYVAFIGYIWYC